MSADFKVKRMAERQAKFWNEQFDFDADIQKDLDEDACFDWLISSDEIMQSGCLDFISPTDRIMMVGVGRSKLAFQMYDKGFTNITCSDISDVLIQDLIREQATLRPLLKFEIVDVTNMSAVESASYDVVIDKCTSDTLQFRSKTKDSSILLDKMYSETHRILKPGGIFVVITPRKTLKIMQDHVGFMCRPRLIIERAEGVELTIPQGKNGAIKSGTKARAHVYMHSCWKKISSEENATSSPALTVPVTHPNHFIAQKQRVEQRNTLWRQLMLQDAAAYFNAMQRTMLASDLRQRLTIPSDQAAQHDAQGQEAILLQPLPACSLSGAASDTLATPVPTEPVRTVCTVAPSRALRDDWLSALNSVLGDTLAAHIVSTPTSIVDAEAASGPACSEQRGQGKTSVYRPLNPLRCLSLSARNCLYHAALSAPMGPREFHDRYDAVSLPRFTAEVRSPFHQLVAVRGRISVKSKLGRGLTFLVLDDIERELYPVQNDALRGNSESSDGSDVLERVQAVLCMDQLDMSSFTVTHPHLYPGNKVPCQPLCIYPEDNHACIQKERIGDELRVVLKDASKADLWDDEQQSVSEYTIIRSSLLPGDDVALVGTPYRDKNDRLSLSIFNFFTIQPHTKPTLQEEKSARREAKKIMRQNPVDMHADGTIQPDAARKRKNMSDDS